MKKMFELKGIENKAILSPGLMESIYGGGGGSCRSQCRRYPHVPSTAGEYTFGQCLVDCMSAQSHN